MDNHQVMVPRAYTLEAEGIALRNAGGCTVIPGARGLWEDETGTVHMDHIDVLLVFEDGTKARDEIVSYLHSQGEQSVCYVTNGVPALVAAPLPPAAPAALQAELQVAA